DLHFADEFIERSDAGFLHTGPEDLRSSHIPCGQIGPSPTPLVFVLDSHDLSWPCRQGLVLAPSSLNACLLVGRDDEIVCCQRLPEPDPLIEVQDATGLLGKVGISREDPASVAPRPYGIFGKPSPYGCLSDG